MGALQGMIGGGGMPGAAMGGLGRMLGGGMPQQNPMSGFLQQLMGGGQMQRMPQQGLFGMLQQMMQPQQGQPMMPQQGILPQVQQPMINPQVQQPRPWGEGMGQMRPPTGTPMVPFSPPPQQLGGMLGRMKPFQQSQGGSFGQPFIPLDKGGQY